MSDICRHPGMLFIQSETGSGTLIDPYRKRASICPHCGWFVIWINGVKMTFALVSDEQVEAAGKYAALLREAR